MCVECPRSTCSKHEATHIKSFESLEAFLCKFYDTLIILHILFFLSLIPYKYSTDCFVTNQCNGTMVNFTDNTIDCCDGCAQGESMESAAVAAGESFDFIRRYRNRISLRTEGCPVSK